MFIQLTQYPVDYNDKRPVVLALDAIESLRDTEGRRMGSHVYFTTVRTKSGDEFTVVESVKQITEMIKGVTG